MFEKVLGTVMIAVDTLTAVAVLPPMLTGVVVLGVAVAAMAWPVLSLLGGDA